jgi:polar amino acid transport system substrate-binding protein
VQRRDLLNTSAQALGLGLLGVGDAATAASAGAFQTASQAGIPFKFNAKSPDKPGICIEIVQALVRVDPELSFLGLERELPLRRIEADLLSGQLDVFFALIRTPEREALRFLSSPVLYAVNHQVAVRADDTVSVSSLDDIRSLGRDGVILTTQGTAYPQYLDDFKGLLVDASTTHNGQLLKMLLAGRGRFFYQGDSTLRHQIKADGLEGKVRILPAVFKVDEQLVAYSPQLPVQRLGGLRKALELLNKNGELQRLRSRYGLE